MKFIIFDIDGTLTDTKDVDDKCFVKAFRQIFNLDISDQKWEELKNVTDWGITEEIIDNKYGRKPSSVEYKSLRSTFVGLLQDEKRKNVLQFKEVQGAKLFFNSMLEMNNVKVGIATGAWMESAALKLNTIGINLNGICFSNSSCFKSRELITKDVISQLRKLTDSEPDEIIYIGDGEWDYKTSEKMGLKFIGIDSLCDGKLSSLGAEKVFNNYENPEDVLNAIFKSQ